MLFDKDFIQSRLDKVGEIAEETEEAEANEIIYQGGHKWLITDSATGTKYFFDIDKDDNISIGKRLEDSWKICTSRWGNNTQEDFEKILMFLHEDPEIVFKEYRTANESVINEVSV